MRPPFSRLSGGLRLGRGFYERHGWAEQPAGATSTSSKPRGVVDALEDLRQPELDLARVHPHVRRFFEDTAGLELFIHTRWRGPFVVLWWLLRPLMCWFGQFVLPRREARILTRCFPLDRTRDGRPDARGVERFYGDTGEVFQVAAYATWEHAGVHHMHASFPMPFGQVAGLLRLDPLRADRQGLHGVTLTSRRRRGRPEDRARVWLLIGRFALPSPLGEQLSLWAPGAPDCPVPANPACPDATILGCHEQRLFGVRFVRHYYWFRPLSVDAPPSSDSRSVNG